MVEPKRPHVVRLEPATELNTALPIRPSKAVRIRAATEHNSAAPITVEISSPGWLAPRPLTGDERLIIGAVTGLGAHYASEHGGSPELTLLVGLVLIILLREFTRRFLPPLS